MSDILEIISHCESEWEESASGLSDSTSRLKNAVKRRKGRGFVTKCDSALENIKHFDRLEPGNKKLIDNYPQKCKVLHFLYTTLIINFPVAVEGWVLFVRGVHEEASEEDVSELFSEYGSVSNVCVNMDRRTGFVKGYALVEFKTFEEANNARENLNETSLLNRTIYVDWGFTQTSSMYASK